MASEKLILNNQLQKEKEFGAFIDYDGEYVEIEPSIDIDNFDGNKTTLDIFNEIKDYMGECYKILQKNGIPFDSIAISSRLGFICKKGLIEKITSLSNRLEELKHSGIDNGKEVEKISQELFDLIFGCLLRNTNRKYIPVDFRLDLTKCSIIDGDKTTTDTPSFEETYQELDEFIKSKSIKGIVNFGLLSYMLNEEGFTGVVKDGRSTSIPGNIERYYLSYIRNYSKKDAKSNSDFTIKRYYPSKDKTLVYVGKKKDNN